MVHRRLRRTWTPPAPQTLSYDRAHSPPICCRHFSLQPDPVVAWQGSRSSLTLGELACAALFPVLAVVDAVLLATARCFQKSPPRLLPARDARTRLRTGLTFRELADLADDSRCCKYQLLDFFRLVLWPEIVYVCLYLESR